MNALSPRIDMILMLWYYSLLRNIKKYYNIFRKENKTASMQIGNQGEWKKREKDLFIESWSFLKRSEILKEKQEFNRRNEFNRNTLEKIPQDREHGDFITGEGQIKG